MKKYIYTKDLKKWERVDRYLLIGTILLIILINILGAIAESSKVSVQSPGEVIFYFLLYALSLLVIGVPIIWISRAYVRGKRIKAIETAVA